MQHAKRTCLALDAWQTEHRAQWLSPRSKPLGLEEGVEPVDVQHAAHEDEYAKENDYF